MTTLPVHSGVRQDLDVLLLNFRAKNSLRFVDFADSFRAMKFVDIFNGRINKAELCEFSENALKIAFSYTNLIDSSRTMRRNDERVFGIYATYALFMLQPRNCIRQVAVTPANMNEVFAFFNEMVVERHLDVVACLLYLFYDEAFHFVPFVHGYDPTTLKRDLASPEEDYVEKREEPFESTYKVLHDEILQELNYLHEAYLEGKKNLGVELSTRLKNPIEEMTKIVELNKEHLDMFLRRRAGEPTQSSENATRSAPDPLLTTGESRSSIRTKAYTTATKHQRHRRYADPRMEENFANLMPRVADIANELLGEEQINTLGADRRDDDGKKGKVIRTGKKKKSLAVNKTNSGVRPSCIEYDPGQEEATSMLVGTPMAEDFGRPVKAVKAEVAESRAAMADALIGGRKLPLAISARVVAPWRKLGGLGGTSAVVSTDDAPGAKKDAEKHAGPSLLATVKREPPLDIDSLMGLPGDETPQPTAKRKRAKKDLLIPPPELSFLKSESERVRASAKEREADRALQRLRARAQLATDLDD